MTDDREQALGGFITTQGTLPGRYYVLTEAWRPQFASVFAERGAQFIRLNRALGWKCESLEFLLGLDGLRGVEIYHWDVTDLSPLRTLVNLELLGLECRFKRFDFTASFPRLRAASVTWRPGCETLLGCTRLESLSISNYPHTDLSSLGSLSLLRQLFVSSRKLLSASGLGRHTALRTLTFSYCASLQDIDAAAQFVMLESLQLSTCKKVRNLAPLGSLANLRRLIVENGVEVDSVRPLAGCTSLEEVFLIGTKVADGDLGALLGLKRLRKVAVARSSKHSHTAEELNAALA